MSSHNVTKASGFGRRLADLRKAAQLTKRHAARQAKVSEAYISRLERGERLPSRIVVEALARVFAVDPDWLATGEGKLLRRGVAKLGDDYDPVKGLDDGRDRLRQLLRSDVPPRISRLPDEYVHRYVKRVQELRAEVADDLRAKLSESANRVERQLADIERLLLAESMAEDRHRRR